MTSWCAPGRRRWPRPSTSGQGWSPPPGDLRALAVQLGRAPPVGAYSGAGGSGGRPSTTEYNRMMGPFIAGRRPGGGRPPSDLREPGPLDRGRERRDNLGGGFWPMSSAIWSSSASGGRSKWTGAGNRETDKRKTGTQTEFRFFLENLGQLAALASSVSWVKAAFVVGWPAREHLCG